MTKESVFKMLVPARFRAKPCRGARRAARRRALLSDMRWQHANAVSLPYRIAKVKRALQAAGLKVADG